MGNRFREASEKKLVTQAPVVKSATQEPEETKRVKKGGPRDTAPEYSGKHSEVPGSPDAPTTKGTSAVRPSSKRASKTSGKNSSGVSAVQGSEVRRTKSGEGASDKIQVETKSESDAAATPSNTSTPTPKTAKVITSTPAADSSTTAVTATKTFRMPVDLIEELELYVAKAKIAGTKIGYSEVLRNALTEYFERHSY